MATRNDEEKTEADKAKFGQTVTEKKALKKGSTVAKGLRDGAKSKAEGVRLGILTSGGDAQGMNAAVRSTARSAIVLGAVPYAIREGWFGAVEGGDLIHELKWGDLSNTISKGGTIIGTARSDEFRERSGMMKAVENLIQNGIDRLVSIGGDGTLSGTEELRQLWPELVAELVKQGRITADQAKAHPNLMVVGLVGSIDNDMTGTDMTIGADSALNRIVLALDQLSSTAASHQRTFVVEVMGRNCGYLALMSAVAGGSDYVLIPEMPPTAGWEDDMCKKLSEGRKHGRRDSIVIVAEGARDREGNPITASYVAEAIEERTKESARVTILGHIQRGGSPSAYDRWMPTLLGYAAAKEVIGAAPGDGAKVLGVRYNRIARLDLTKAVADTRHVRKLIEAGEYDKAVASRGSSFTDMVDVFRVLSTPPSLLPPLERKAKRVAIMHVGGLAPGMNMAARAAVRFGLQRGLEVLGVQGSFQGLVDGDIRTLDWKDVEGWDYLGGAELGTKREIPTIEEFYAIGRSVENHKIDALILIGGYNSYLSAQGIAAELDRYPALKIPMLLVPASIDNNLPGAEISIGTDTALNNLTWSMDLIKESAAASKRCFVAETMGRHCGYLALMSSISSGAETTYLEEDTITLEQLGRDAAEMRKSFKEGRRLALVVRNELAGEQYDLDFMADVFKQESHGFYDVRTDAIGYLQQGGAPSPFDRLLATRLMYRAMARIDEALDNGENRIEYIGEENGKVSFHEIADMEKQVDPAKRRPREQWWMSMRPLIGVMASSKPAVKDFPLPVVDLTRQNPEETPYC
ncbi:MAG: 6-phosphofructokinase [Mobiluncus porci]|uniref:6-phosphofructokinase n=1 Tax=Mobiluncus porci TaxID=2652278 RepID=UPI0023F4EF66|nr:6-phosphofructokinase [Mobiluncus porci]MDD7541269.1 6-phosphofructokinase [Mobiluncus porci]MDY5749477.1 6-phosphofructokinase [Mobiluncus porci]